MTPAAPPAPLPDLQPAAVHADFPAPQGLYGVGTAPLAKGEVWVQDAEVVYLSVEAGLGRGWSVAVEGAGVPYQQLAGLEVAYTAHVGEWDVRGLAGGYTGIATLLPGNARFYPGALVGVGAGTGPRGSRTQASLRVGLGEIVSLFPEVDGMWTLGRHTALLVGAAAVWTPADRYLVLLAGPAVRLSWGRFSLDLGAQAAFGPSVHLGDADGAFTGWGVIPVPTLALRYGFGGA
jgi:hypothetical protein